MRCWHSVSVVCPFYQSQAFLAEAIDSVRAQTYAQWELLLIDDGSTDGGLEIAKRYAVADPERIQVLRHADGANHGASATRNLGIAHATGEYLAFLDADDVYLSGKLAVQVAALEEHPEVVMTFAPAVRWNRWPGNANGASENSTQDMPQDFTVPVLIDGHEAGSVLPGERLLQTYLLDESQTPCTCSVLIRRAAALAAGCFDPQFRGLFDDQVFYAKILTGHAVHFLGDPVAKYRQHAASCCAMARMEGIEGAERARFLHWLSAYRKNKP